MARRAEPVVYGLELGDVGPLLEVAGDRHPGAAWVSMEVGYWGIGLRLQPDEVQRLRDQLDSILATPLREDGER